MVSSPEVEAAPLRGGSTGMNISKGSLCGSLLRLVTQEEHSVNCFVADDVPGNQETAIGIVHQIGPFGT
jgi:hypothetical protein